MNSRKFALTTLILFLFAVVAIGVVPVVIKHESWSFFSFGLAPTTLSLGTGVGVKEYTLTSPDKSMYLVGCPDTDGCRFYLGETGVPDGHVVTLVFTAANTTTVTDVADIREMSGDFAAGIYDTLVLQYNLTRWVELSEQDN